MNKLLREFLSYILVESKGKGLDMTTVIPYTDEKGKQTSAQAKTLAGYDPGTRGRQAYDKWAAQQKAKGNAVVTDKKPKSPKKIDGRTAAQADKTRAAVGRALKQTSEPQTATPDAAQETVDTAYVEASTDSRLGKLFKNIKNKVSQVRRMMALKAFETTVETRLPDDKKEQGRRLSKGIEALLEADARGDTKTARRIVKELQDEFNFYSNAAGKTFKTKVFGMGERHFLGKTALAANMVELFDKYRPEGTPSIKEAEDQDSTFKGKIEGTSKAKYGEYVVRTNKKGEQVRVFKPDAFTAAKSPRVATILSSLPQIAERFKALYGPTGPDGDLLDNTGGKNSREYFKHAISRNSSLDETAAALDSGGFPKMAKAIRDHKKRLEEIEQNWDNYSPEERETAVQQSYSDMAVQLHSTALGGDSEMCSAIMKNLAEASLYESELAGGKEVYLPAAGSFPAADKLIRVGGGTKAERIEKISVKFGKNGKVYGMPAQSSTIALMHKDSFYHGLTAGRCGIEGSETGVSSRVLERRNWERLIEESGYSSCLRSKKAGETIRKAYEHSQAVIAQERAKLRPQPPDNKAIARMMRENKAIEKARRAVGQALEDGIDKDKLLKLSGAPPKVGGQERVALIKAHPHSFASMMTMDATIVSSGGLTDLKHAHMEMIDEDGDGAAERMGTVVEDGDAELSHWHYSWRETDERGGGLLTGFARPSHTPTKRGKK